MEMLDRDVQVVHYNMRLTMAALMLTVLSPQTSNGFLFAFFQDCALSFSLEAALDTSRPLCWAQFSLPFRF